MEVCTEMFLEQTTVIRLGIYVVVMITKSLNSALHSQRAMHV